MRPILSLIAAIALVSCTRREPGPQDSKSASDQREQVRKQEQASPGEAITGAPAAKGAEQPALSELAVDDRFGFELAYPKGWTATEGPGMPALFVTSAMEGLGDAFVENVNVVVEQLPATMSAEAYADGSLTLMQTDLTAFHEVSRSAVEIAGQPAVRREYEHTFAGRPLWVVSYMLVVEQRAYVITATAERERAEGWRSLLESIARSFRLTAK